MKLSIPFQCYISQAASHNPIAIAGATVMKSLVQYGLAAAMVFATAMPAIAHEPEQEFDICVGSTDTATQDDPTKPGASLTAAANIYAEGTIPTGGVAKCSDID